MEDKVGDKDFNASGWVTQAVRRHIQELLATEFMNFKLQTVH